MAWGSRRRPSRWVQAVLVLTMLLTIPVAIEYVRQAGLRGHWLQAEREVQARLAALEAEHEELQALKEYVQTDAYAEQAARARLKLARPGEVLVVVVGTPTPGFLGE